MKRVFALLLATLLSVTALGGCGHPDLNMDRYQYDGYQNVQWGSTPEDVVSQLGLSKKQVDRLEPSKMDEGLPEGTFGYEVTKTCMLFGMFVETRLYFAESLYGMDQYSGLYEMKIVLTKYRSTTNVLPERLPMMIPTTGWILRPSSMSMICGESIMSTGPPAPGKMNTAAGKRSPGPVMPLCRICRLMPIPLPLMRQLKR